MKIKKFLSLFLTVALSATALCYPLSTSAAADYSYKIDEALAEKLDAIDGNDTVKVSVWFKGISDSDLERSYLSNVTQEIENNNLNESVLELLSESEYDSDNQNNNQNISAGDANKLISIKRNTNANRIQSYNAQCISDIVAGGKADNKDITYVDALLPNVEMNLSKNKIYNLASDSEVEAIYSCAEIDFPDFSATSESIMSVGTSVDNSTIYNNTGISALKESYDGSDMFIGIISDRRPDLDLDAICEADILAPKHRDEDLPIDSGTSDLSNFIATQLVGSYGNYEGIVPGASLCFRTSDTEHWKSDINFLVLEKKVNMLCLLFEGVEGVSGTYGDIAKWIDALVNHNSITVIQPVNKSGTANEVSASAMAYNAIAVGGASGSVSVSAHNGSGLSYKPDIVAPFNMSVRYNSTNNGSLNNTASAAGLVTGAMALLMDAQISLITCPHLAKSILLNGATYYGTKNSKYFSTGSNPDPSFVAFDRTTGVGSINLNRSLENYVSRAWNIGTLNAGQETFSGSFLVPEANSEVHINFCALKNNTFNGAGNAVDSNCPNITMTVKYGNVRWTSAVTTDNKCSIVFNADYAGTYEIYLTSDIYISKSALSHLIF